MKRINEKTFHCFDLINITKRLFLLSCYINTLKVLYRLLLKVIRSKKSTIIVTILFWETNKAISNSLIKRTMVWARLIRSLRTTCLNCLHFLFLFSSSVKKTERYGYFWRWRKNRKRDGESWRHETPRRSFLKQVITSFYYHNVATCIEYTRYLLDHIL